MEACPACTADAKSLGARIATLCSSSKRRKSIKSIALDESNIGAACGAFDNAATIAAMSTTTVRPKKRCV